MSNMSVGFTGWVALILAASSSQIGFAHEGHGTTPGASKNLFGGIVQGKGALDIELVNEPAGLKLYPLTEDKNTKELKIIPLKEVKVEVSAFVPGKPKKKVDFVPTQEEDPSNAHFFGKVDPKQLDKKSVHRYSLEVKASYQGKTETITFPVEPQR